MKNFLLKWAVWLIRFFLKTHPEENRILIVATTALGDTLWATPAIENIRKTFPKAHLAVLTSPIGTQVLKHNPHIDQIYLFKNLFSLWKELYKNRFDTALIFHASQRAALPFCSLLGARRIIGTRGINKGLDFLLTHPMDNCHQHEIVRRLEIAKKIGAKTFTESLCFYLQKEEMEQSYKTKPLIALHPGSKDPFKRWPKENFMALGCKLKEALDCDILITGTQEERALTEEIARAIPKATVAPNYLLREFAAELMNIDLLISNDTGPVHLASALSRPTLVIYCSTDPALCGPHLAPHTRAISKKPTCSPCIKRKCQNPFCFLQIGVNEVFETAQMMLAESAPCEK